MVRLSGMLEILGGLGLFVPATRRTAAWGADCAADRSFSGQLLDGFASGGGGGRFDCVTPHSAPDSDTLVRESFHPPERPISEHGNRRERTLLAGVCSL